MTTASSRVLVDLATLY